MKNYLLLSLLLIAPLNALGGTALQTEFTEKTNLVSRYGNDVADGTATRLTGTLPDLDNMPNPFIFAVMETGFGASSVASSNDTYLRVAEYDATNDDLPFMDEDEDVIEVFDPLEPVNRGIFWFNDKVYFYFMKPIARGYRFVLPEPVRVSVGNFFSNLAFPVRFINSGLQGKFSASGTELARFGINTTIGLLGFFDPAESYFDMKLTDEDTGQTFGRYGIGPGPYVVIPFIGPSSLRDGIGMVADGQLNIMPHLLENQDYFGALFLRIINTLSLDKDTYEGIKKDALDPYLFVRDAWSQYRRNLVEN